MESKHILKVLSLIAGLVGCSMTFWIRNTLLDKCSDCNEVMKAKQTCKTDNDKTFNAYSLMFVYLLAYLIIIIGYISFLFYDPNKMNAGTFIMLLLSIGGIIACSIGLWMQNRINKNCNDCYKLISFGGNATTEDGKTISYVDGIWLTLLICILINAIIPLKFIYDAMTRQQYYRTTRYY